jgi:hypothetical protein
METAKDIWGGCRRNWWRLVFAAVGAVAAVVSYGHIVNLFLSWHAPLYDARLMPVAIDGLIIIGAGAANSGQKGLGWSAIGPGLAASLYANVMNGLPHGYGAAMGSGWATVALFLASNVMERWKPADAGVELAGVRDQLAAALEDASAGQAEAARLRDQLAAAARAAADRRPERRKPPQKKGPGRMSIQQARETALGILRDDPDVTGEDLGRQCGRSARWGQTFIQEYKQGLRAVK